MWVKVILSTCKTTSNARVTSDVIVENELLFFSDGFKSIRGCCVQRLAVLEHNLPCTSVLFAPQLIPFYFEIQKHNDWLETHKKKEKILNRKESLLHRWDDDVKHARLSCFNTFADALKVKRGLTFFKFIRRSLGWFRKYEVVAVSLTGRCFGGGKMQHDRGVRHQPDWSERDPALYV